MQLSTIDRDQPCASCLFPRQSLPEAFQQVQMGLLGRVGVLAAWQQPVLRGSWDQISYRQSL